VTGPNLNDKHRCPTDGLDAAYAGDGSYFGMLYLLYLGRFNREEEFRR
jgi:hypothetical protein